MDYYSLLKRFRIILVALIVSLLFALTSIHILLVKQIKKNDANIILDSIYNQILLGENRGVLVAINRYVPNSYLAIRLYSSNQNKIIEIEKDQEGDVLRSESSFLNSIRMPIFFDKDNKKNEFGFLEFRYNPLQWYGITVVIFLLFSFLIALYLFREMKQIRRINDIEQEKNRNLAIARTAQMMAHDIRKPFSLLAMSLKSLECCRSLDEVNDLVNTLKPEIIKSKNYVERMLEETLSFDRAVPVKIEPCNLFHLMNEEIQTLNEMYSGKSIVLSWEVANDLVVQIDSYRIIRILQNLYKNAIEAVPKGGKIKTTASLIKFNHKTFLNVNIQNSTDRKLTKSETAKFMQPFYTNKENGTGLGMAIVQKCIEELGGTLKIETLNEPAIGVYFTVPLK